MSKKNNPTVRVDPKFYREFIRNIQLDKMKKGKQVKTSRIFTAMSRHPNIKQMREDIKKADLV